MNKLYIILILLFLLFTELESYSQYKLMASNIPNGGGISTSSKLNAYTVIGQVLIGDIKSSQIDEEGFIYLIRYYNAKGLVDVKDNNYLSADEATISIIGANPVYTNTNLKITFPKPGFANLKMVDLLGRNALDLLNEFCEAGNKILNINTDQLTSGTYQLILSYDKTIKSTTMVVIH